MRDRASPRRATSPMRSRLMMLSADDGAFDAREPTCLRHERVEETREGRRD